MATRILIQDMDERCLARLESRAAEHGRSLPEEARMILEDAVHFWHERFARRRVTRNARRSDPGAGLKDKDGILVFSGRATGDLQAAVERGRRQRQEKLLNWKAE